MNTDATLDTRNLESLLHDFHDHEAFGIDFSALGTTKRSTLAHQDAFLAAFSRDGTIYRAAPAVGITRMTVQNWNNDNTMNFRDRFQVAQGTFAESLEDTAMQRIANPSGNRGSDVLLMAMLNAHLPAKYRQNIVVTDDTAKDVLKQLQARRTKRTTAEDVEPETKAPTPIEAMRERAQGT